MVILMSTLTMQVSKFRFPTGSQLIYDTGKFSERDMPDYSSRNFEERGFTVGIGGYVPYISADIRTLIACVPKACWFWKDSPRACTLSETKEGIQHRFVLNLNLGD